MDNLKNHVHDMVGIRIVCSFLSDVKNVVEMISNCKRLIIKDEKDYITNPKESGYISYHLIVYVPIFFGEKEELVEAERTVTGQLYVDFENAEEVEGAIFPYMPYPTDANGNKLIGEAGQIYMANGDGTYSWLSVQDAEGGAY